MEIDDLLNILIDTFRLRNVSTKEGNAIRFDYCGSRYRVDTFIFVEEVSNGVLHSNVRADFIKKRINETIEKRK